jgi:ParB family chromosome partitioning protein
MTLKNVALSALCPSKDNPRRHLDKDAIAGLAESIKTDGVLQNLVVEKNGDGMFRVVSGSRRFLALKLLKRQGVIDGDYKVPVEIRSLEEGDALRIATIENVQRADLDPIDEAEAFARMLQNGASLDDVSAKTGLSEQTIRRRVALSDLCDEVKDAIQKGEVPLGIAEAMTLGTHEQQRSLLSDLREGAELDRESIRDMLCAQRPSVAIAIFPLEKYSGTLIRRISMTSTSSSLCRRKRSKRWRKNIAPKLVGSMCSTPTASRGGNTAKRKRAGGEGSSSTCIQRARSRSERASGGTRSGRRWSR